MAKAYEKSDKKDKANKYYTKVAESHDNGMGLATIQQRAKEKLQSKM